MDPEPLNPTLAADLAALADGTLPPERATALEHEVATSPRLAQAVAEQQRTREALRTVAVQRAPERLHAAVAVMLAEAEAEPAVATPARRDEAAVATPARQDEAAVATPARQDEAAVATPARQDEAATATPARRPGGRLRDRWADRKGWAIRVPQLRWSLPTAAVAAAIIAMVIVSGGTSSPSVAEAAQVALKPASAPPPAPVPQTKHLADPVEGVAYPDWSADTDWQAVGSRSDVLHDRTIRTVSYTNDQGQRIGYAIVAGDALPVDGGRTIEQGAVRYRLLTTDGATVLTWQRSGHTSILVARGVDAAVLLQLAGRPVS